MSGKEKVAAIVLGVLNIIVIVGCIAILVFGTYGSQSGPDRKVQKVKELKAQFNGKSDIGKDSYTITDGEKLNIPASKDPKEKDAEVGDTGNDVTDDVDVENEVLRIRGIFNDIQSNLDSYTSSSISSGKSYISEDGKYQKITVKKGKNGIDYARDYYYEDGKLIFAFYYKGKWEQRFYFHNEIMFRWINEDKTIYDQKTDDTNWKTWETSVLKEGRAVINE